MQEKSAKNARCFVGAHVNWSVTLARQNRFPEAREHLMIAVTMRPRDIQANHNLAQLVLAMNQPDEAERFLRQTVEFVPDHALAHVQLARLLAAQGRMEEAHVEAATADAIER
jgi:predicted Zn-dependent protease